jgi:NAD(P)-dependent dehydrogenase (short-subunit alcohol dehydrogenase family)
MSQVYSPRSLVASSSLRAALSQKRVLITGASLDGVGRIIAHLYSLHGAQVALADILPLDAVAEECRALGAARVVCCSFDAGKEGDSARMVKEIALKLGALDAVFLNHNAGCFAPMFEQPDLIGTARRLMRINFFSYAEIADAALPLLANAARARPRGPKSSIVVISSLAAEMPMLDTHAYAASKAAISSWFNCMRIELRRDADLAPLIAVSIVYFSAVRTATLVSAMGGEGGPNQHVLKLAATPLDAARATIDACISGRPVTHFPSNIAILPKLYSIWPWLARRLVSAVTVKHPSPSPAANE